VQRPGEQPACGHLTGVGVHLDLIDHEGYRPLGIAGGHGLTHRAAPVAVPDDLDPLLLGLDGAGQELDHHIVYGPVKRDLLRQLLHLARPAVFYHLLKSDAGLLHLGNAYGPVVEGGAEGDISPGGIQLPAGLIFLLVHSGDELVDIVNDLAQPGGHILGLNLQLIDHAVHFVDEENRPDSFPQSLAQHRLRLGHGPFYRIYHDHCPVHGPHGPGDVTAEVHVTRGVDHIDQIFLAFYLMDHGYIGCIDGDSPGLLQGVEIHEELPAGQVHGDHACAAQKVIRKGCLAVIYMCHDSDVPDHLRLVHQGHDTFCYLLPLAHNTPREV